MLKLTLPLLALIALSEVQGQLNPEPLIQMQCQRWYCARIQITFILKHFVPLIPVNTRRYSFCHFALYNALTMLDTIIFLKEQRIFHTSVRELVVHRCVQNCVGAYITFEVVSIQSFLVYLNTSRLNPNTVSNGDTTNRVSNGMNIELDQGWQGLMHEIKFCTIHQRHLESERDIYTPQNQPSPLGEGQFAKVFHGRLKFWRLFRTVKKTVAIKCLEYESFHVDIFREELKNIVKLGSSEHPNLVKFLGICWSSDSCKCFANIVMEFCEQGCMKSFLVKQRESFPTPIPHSNSILHESDNVARIGNDLWNKLKSLVEQIANGMDFLVTQNIVHGDLAARNVLLTRDFVPKITDFGMARTLYSYQVSATSLHTVFPWKWMAPESLDYLKFSTKTDVWSYGVLLWETFTLGSNPWPGLNWTSSFLTELKAGTRLAKPDYISNEMYSGLMCKCWDLDSSLRPSFKDIVQYFRSVKNLI